MVGATLSHYTIVEPLGTGGMGRVYKAEDTRLKRFVALKFLPAHLTSDPLAKERFSREAQAASSLQHRNICTIHDIDQTPDGQMYIVMDLYEGETLKTRLERDALSSGEIRAITTQIANGLGEAHRHGLVHRDIKPGNIMLTTRDEVKILDFGLAKLSCQTGITEAGMTPGTVAYMSPEQTRGDKVDYRTDIWSFGVVLYEMLTGTHPFRGEHPMALLYSIQNEEPDEVPLRRPGIPDDLRSICLRCLAKEKSRRPSSMDDLTAILAAPVKRRVSIARVIRRVPRIARWAAAAALALIGFLIYTLTSARSITLDPADSIVVSDFENLTGEHFLDHSLTEAVRVSLRQSAQFMVLPRERIAAALEFLKMNGKTVLDEPAAIAVARREGARVVVSGSVDRVGSLYLLRCSIIDAANGETVKLLRQEVPAVEACLGGIDRICEDLRSSLGESMSQISRARGRLQDVTTSSLEALELYSQAVKLESEGRYHEASIANERAVTLDPEFVQAISDLAYEHRKLGNDSLAVAYHNRILPLIHRVTDRERLEILASYYGPSFEADFPKAFQYVRELTVRYPNDAFAFATLGHLAMSIGDAKTALEANGRAVAMYPEYAKTCYNNSGYALALNGRYEEALGWFRKAKELRPDYPAIDAYMAQVRWMEGRFDSAEAILRTPVSGADPSQRIQRSVMLGALYYFQGRLDPAQDALAAGIADCRQLGRPADEAYLHYFLGEIHAAAGDMAGYKREMAAATALASSPYYDLLFAGRSYARHRMRRELVEVLARLTAARSHDPVFARRRVSFIALLSGELSLMNGQAEEARRNFEEVERFRAGDPVYQLAREGLAECSARLADSSVTAQFRNLVAERGDNVMGYVSSIRQSGPWIRQLWPDACLRNAEEHVKRGQREAALRCLDSAMSCWKTADADDQLAWKARMLRTRLAAAE